MMKKCFVFAHYDKSNVVKDYIIKEISFLNTLGDVLFISDCECISNLNELPKIKYIQVSRHGLYDAHSYMCGFEYLRNSKQLLEYDNITFVNSSIMFPTCDEKVFVDAINKMDSGEESIYGMCKSRFLLQSYWITCKRNTYDLIHEFFKNYLPATTETTRDWWKSSKNKPNFKDKYVRWYNERVKEVGEELTLKWIYTVVNFEEGFSLFFYKKHFTLVALDYGCWPKSRFITKVPRKNV